MSTSLFSESRANHLCAAATALVLNSFVGKDTDDVSEKQRGEKISPDVSALPPFVDCTLHLLLRKGFYFIDNAQLCFIGPQQPKQKSLNLEKEEEVLVRCPLPGFSRLDLFDACLLPNGDWIFTGGAYGGAIHLFSRPHHGTRVLSDKTGRDKQQPSSVKPPPAPIQLQAFDNSEQRPFLWKRSIRLTSTTTSEDLADPSSEEAKRAADQWRKKRASSASSPLSIAMIPNSSVVAICDRGLGSVVLLNWRTLDLVRCLPCDDAAAIVVAPPSAAAAVGSGNTNRDEENQIRELIVSSCFDVRRLLVKVEEEEEDAERDTEAETKMAVIDRFSVTHYSSEIVFEPPDSGEDEEEEDDDDDDSTLDGLGSRQIVTLCVAPNRFLIVQENEIREVEVTPTTPNVTKVRAGCNGTTPPIRRKGEIVNYWPLPRRSRDAFDSIKESKHWALEIKKARKAGEDVDAASVFEVRQLQLEDRRMERRRKKNEEEDTVRDWVVLAATSVGIVRLTLTRRRSDEEVEEEEEDEEAGNVQIEVVQRTEDVTYGVYGVGMAYF